MSKIKRQFHKTTHGTSIPHTVYDTTFASLVMHAAAMIANDALSGAPQSLKPTVKPKPTVTTVAVPIAKDVNPKTVNPTVQPIATKAKISNVRQSPQGRNEMVPLTIVHGSHDGLSRRCVSVIAGQ